MKRINAMTINQFIDRLTLIAKAHGWDAPVFTLDREESLTKPVVDLAVICSGAGSYGSVVNIDLGRTPEALYPDVVALMQADDIDRRFEIAVRIR